MSRHTQLSTTKFQALCLGDGVDPRISICPSITWDNVISFGHPRKYVSKVLTGRRQVMQYVEDGMICYVAAAMEKCYNRQRSCSSLAIGYGLDLCKLKSVYKAVKVAIVTSWGFGGMPPVILYETPSGAWHVARDDELVAAGEAAVFIQTLFEGSRRCNFTADGAGGTDRS